MRAFVQALQYRFCARRHAERRLYGICHTKGLKRLPNRRLCVLPKNFKNVYGLGNGENALIAGSSWRSFCEHNLIDFFRTLGSRAAVCLELLALELP